MGTPIFYIKSDAAGEMFEVTDAVRIVRGGESYAYSDESRAADAEWTKVKAKLPPAPVRPDWPRKPADLPEKHTKKAEAEHTRAMKAWDKARAEHDIAWKAYIEAEQKWRDEVITPNADKVREKWRKKWVARMAGTQPGLVRIDVGPGGPVMARNLVKRLRRVQSVDAKALHRLDQQIARLQMERATLILASWDRGEPTTSEHLVAVADNPPKARAKLTRPVLRTDLDGVHMVTRYAVEKRGREAA